MTPQDLVGRRVQIVARDISRAIPGEIENQAGSSPVESE